MIIKTRSILTSEYKRPFWQRPANTALDRGVCALMTCVCMCLCLPASVCFSQCVCIFVHAAFSCVSACVDLCACNYTLAGVCVCMYVYVCVCVCVCVRVYTFEERFTIPMLLRGSRMGLLGYCYCIKCKSNHTQHSRQTFANGLN